MQKVVRLLIAGSKFRESGIMRQILADSDSLVYCRGCNARHLRQQRAGVKEATCGALTGVITCRVSIPPTVRPTTPVWQLSVRRHARVSSKAERVKGELRLAISDRLPVTMAVLYGDVDHAEH